MKIPTLLSPVKAKKAKRDAEIVAKYQELVNSGVASLMAMNFVKKQHKISTSRAIYYILQQAGVEMKKTGRPTKPITAHGPEKEA